MSTEEAVVPVSVLRELIEAWHDDAAAWSESAEKSTSSTIPGSKHDDDLADVCLEHAEELQCLIAAAERANEGGTE